MGMVRKVDSYHNWRKTCGSDDIWLRVLAMVEKVDLRSSLKVSSAHTFPRSQSNTITDVENVLTAVVQGETRKKFCSLHAEKRCMQVDARDMEMRRMSLVLQSQIDHQWYVCGRF